MTEVVIGLDIGSSSTKAVAVRADGTIIASVRAPHDMDRPQPGWYEQDAQTVWWELSASLLRELTAHETMTGNAVVALAVSGIGPCLLPCDADGTPLRPAMLYGIDSRAGVEIDELTSRLGADRILARGGSPLSSQAIGPKLAWLQRNEPDVWASTRQWFSSSSFLVRRLTGRYILDHHTASQCNPLYDINIQDWARDWAEELNPDGEPPELAWSEEIVGHVTQDASGQTGLPSGTPVLAGTVDAWAEAHSVGVRDVGDLMIMYGSTIFMIGVSAGTSAHPGLWRTQGLTPGATSLAAGMNAAGLLTSWVADITAHRVEDLAGWAAETAPGADGLALLPYFAGERSPLFDPGARGVAFGLALHHTTAHLMRAAYEGVAMGVRHILEAFDGLDHRRNWRVVAVGGGAADGIFPQIVSDVTGLEQSIPEQTIGACYGDALLAATAIGLVPGGTDWTKIASVSRPKPQLATLYERRYQLYRELYATTRPLVDLL